MSQKRLAQISSHLPTRSKTTSYVVQEEPLGTARQIRIVTIGAGASGLNATRTLRRQLINYEHTVYEKNPEVGGTWYENRYPGCKCDIPSHNYQFAWKPNPQWSEFFSSAKEIQKYLCDLCDEEMRREIKTEHEVVEALWNEESGTWKLRVKNLSAGTVFDDSCHFLLNAGGILNNWKWPDIQGLHEFTGNLIHSANWPVDYDWKGQRVAVIGNGSSGVQIVPAMQKDVKQLVHFFREPTWIVPPRLEILSQGEAGTTLDTIQYDEEGRFSPEQIAKFKSDPDLYRKFVKAVEKETNNNFFATLKDSDTHKFATAMVEQHMREKLGHNETLIKAFLPEFPLGCRRLTPGVGYLESLTQPNVRVVTDAIVRAVPTGLITQSGETFEVDAIVCATGFDVSFRPRFPIFGRQGNLQDVWDRHTPRAYMSCAIPDLPNYFVFLGPNAPIGHGSVFTITELLAKYIVGIIQKCQVEGIKAIAPSRPAVDQLYEHTQVFMPRTAWAGSCSSWFKGGTVNGPVTALHPGSRIHFFHMLERFRGEDWDYVHLDKYNRFAYLGNGFSTKELDGSDSTWYLDVAD